MDSYEGTATLEWWANRSTCLGRLHVRVAVRAAGDDWTCEATLEPPLAAEDRESFDFLMQLDPHFTLRFDDASALLVNVVEAGVEGRLSLTAAEADTAEPTGTRHVPHQ
ncbi:hypothetical protein ACWIID_35645 [Streptomyces phaeochromogenes]|uniref:Uncharacterized protein n=1 Tax=Streptomyces ureilyticus TaxID=1775131 RepID=A0ABX0E783_9ACTN|nr:hypothetical protein [Streptomyces ureilyticus]NGO49492.1 hypothetical protein [Streptomyces ureilyticus]